MRYVAALPPTMGRGIYKLVEKARAHSGKPMALLTFSRHKKINGQTTKLTKKENGWVVKHEPKPEGNERNAVKSTVERLKIRRGHQRCIQSRFPMTRASENMEGYSTYVRKQQDQNNQIIRVPILPLYQTCTNNISGTTRTTPPSP